MNIEEQYLNIMTTLATLVQASKDTNEHLSRLNGKVAAHEGKITQLIIWQARMQGAAMPFKAIWTVIISVISGGIVIVWGKMTNRI